MVWDLIWGVSCFYKSKTEEAKRWGKSAIRPISCCRLSITVVSTPPSSMIKSIWSYLSPKCLLVAFTKYQILHTAQWSMGFVGFECFDLQEIMLRMHFNSTCIFSLHEQLFFYASLPHVTIFCTIMYIVQATRPSKMMWLYYFQFGYVKIFCMYKGL